MFVVVPLANVPSPEKTERVSIYAPTANLVHHKVHSNVLDGHSFSG